MRQGTATHGYSAGGEVEVFDYPPCPGAPPQPAWDGWVEAEEDGAATDGAGSARGRAGDRAFDTRLKEETSRSFEAGRERGRQEGREMERQAQAQGLAAEEERRKRQLAGLIENFAGERDRFLHAVEQEVVKLALAVAARILRREAQMDPLLLTGAVRVALGQLAGTSEVRVRVPAAEADLWRETVALLPHLTMKPEVVAGEGMRLGDCVIESRVGTVDLGVRSQLGEIERGFFDRAGSAAKSGDGADTEEESATRNSARREALR